VQEWLDYVFQLKYNGVDQAYKSLKKKRGQVLGSIPSKRGEGLQSEYTISDDDARREFELTIATFACPDSLYKVDRWLKFLWELAGENTLKAKLF
jgi:hypothetical protein